MTPHILLITENYKAIIQINRTHHFEGHYNISNKPGLRNDTSSVQINSFDMEGCHEHSPRKDLYNLL